MAAAFSFTRSASFLWISLSILLLLTTIITALPTPPKSFYGSVNVVRGGRSFAATMYYDYGLSRMALNFTFTANSPSSMLELNHYDQTQQFQMCSPANKCQNIVWDQPMFKFFLPSDNSAVQLSDEVVGGVTCEKYTLNQGSGWSSTLWFNKVTGYIVKGVFTKQSTTEEYYFPSSVITPVSNTAVFTPGANCGSITCFVQLDLVIVIDDSDSIDNAGWQASLDFAVDVVNSFPTIGVDDVRIGIVTFSDSATTQIGISSDKSAILNALNHITRTRGQTSTAAAVAAAQALLNNGRSVSKSMIVLTDGRPNVPAPDSNALQTMINNANIAKQAGTTIFAIGVGPLINVNTLNFLASTPNEDYVALVDDFSQLATIKEKLIKSVCSGEQRASCQNCNAQQGFCACGTCQCLDDCNTLTSGCNKGVCGSNGVCTTTSIATANCNGRGTVNPNKCDSCICNSPWSGNDCLTCSKTNADCNSHGTINSNTCSCSCTSPWTGSDCSTCSWNCNSRGTPNANCNGCNCVTPWQGINCQTCPRDSSFCSHGSFSSSTCKCSCPGGTGWTGDACDTCTWSCTRSGTPNANCDGCNCPTACSNGGTINNANCACTCPFPWALDSNTQDCTKCASNAASTLCTRGGTVSSDNGCNICNCPTACSNGGTRNADCSCTCTAPWAQNPSTKDCTVCTETAASLCNNHGTPDSTCTKCTCTSGSGWTGNLCNTCGRDQSYCVHGTIDAATCKCTCPVGSSYTGSNCGTCSLTCSNGGSPNANCNGCDCVAPWGGATCTTCGRTNSFCKNGGTINSGTCKCNCPNGWGGDDCSQCTWTNSKCNGRGLLKNTCDACDCDAPWSGQFCTTCSRPQGYCIHGSLNSGTCNCDCPSNTGYTGPTCNTCSWTDAKCNGRGTLKDTCDGCTCNVATPWWTGQFCDQCSRPAGYCKNGGTVNPADCTTCQCVGGFTPESQCETCGRPSDYCGAHGSLDPATCSCKCVGGWTGNQCDVCPEANKLCANGGTFDTATCKCTCPTDYQYTGVTCATCPSPMNCSQATNKGVGLPQLGVNVCQCLCYGYWVGLNCNECGLTATTCNHGSADQTQCKCTCDDRWEGEACSKCAMTQSDCMHGIIDSNLCKCNCSEQWAGITCDTCPITEQNCLVGTRWDPDNCRCCECDEESQCCDGCHWKDNEPCQDELWCTTDDKCLHGVCTGTPTCVPQNECFSMECLEANQTCVETELPPPCCLKLEDCPTCTDVDGCVWCGDNEKCKKSNPGLDGDQCSAECPAAERPGGGDRKTVVTAVAVAVPLAALTAAGAVGAVIYLRRARIAKPADPFEMKDNPTAVVDGNPLYEQPLGGGNPFFEEPGVQPTSN